MGGKGEKIVSEHSTTCAATHGALLEQCVHISARCRQTDPRLDDLFLALQETSSSNESVRIEPANLGNLVTSGGDQRG